MYWRPTNLPIFTPLKLLRNEGHMREDEVRTMIDTDVLVALASTAATLYVTKRALMRFYRTRDDDPRSQSQEE